MQKSNCTASSKIIRMILLYAMVCIAGISFWGQYRLRHQYDLASDDRIMVNEESSYYGSSQCHQQMQREAWMTAEIIADSRAKTDGTDWSELLDNRFDSEVSNSQYKVKRWNTQLETFVFSSGNIDSIGTYGAQGIWLFVSTIDSYGSYVYRLIPGSDFDEAKKNDLLAFSTDQIVIDYNHPAYLITIAVRDPVVLHDGYYDSYQIYQFINRYSFLYLPLLILSSIAAAVLFILQCRSAGYRAEDDAVHPSVIDKIPFEIFAACIILADVLFVKNTDRIAMPEKLIPFLVCFACTDLLIQSTIVRLRASVFTQTSLICRVYRYCHLYPSAWSAAVVIALIIFIGGTLFLLPAEQPVIAVIVLIADITLIAAAVSAARAIPLLTDIEKQLSEGNIESSISEKDLSKLHGPFYEQGVCLNSIQQGIQKAVNEQMKSERLKAELITNVSHDLRTPLTSIINYTDFLQKDHTEEEEKEYLDIIAMQAKRLKRLCTDVVDASKASTGNLPVNYSSVSVSEMIEQSLAEYEERLEKASLSVITNIRPSELSVTADGRLLWRVLSNLLSNVCKYAAEGSRVYIDAASCGSQMVIISIKNISREPLNISAEELMERFVRGDASRHSEGSGLGLSIARSLVELMDGNFEIHIDGDLFRADLTLKESSVKEKS